MTNAAFVDFSKIDFENNWTRPDGAPEGVSVKVLAGALDHAAKRGRCTTLTRWRAGTEVAEAITHEYTEEVYVIAGSLLWLDRGGTVRVEANSYVCRPAGVPHGPFRADEDYLAIEFCYYEDPTA
ncbi:MAG: cupin domain-containing protein [Alphaproteobacteria bacterium]|nr:cupin domain-containing protein [Alphaproteobacteria bacterium]